MFLQIGKTQKFTTKRNSPSTFQHGLSIRRWIPRIAVDTKMKKRWKSSRADVQNKIVNMKGAKGNQFSTTHRVTFQMKSKYRRPIF